MTELYCPKCEQQVDEENKYCPNCGAKLPDPERIYNYDAMAQEALRNVVTQVLQRVSVRGLEGCHKIYLAFDTQYPGVDLPDQQRQQYPDGLTIILHKVFRDLEVTSDLISVEVQFDGEWKKVRIPVKSITGFLDSGVDFGLQFKSENEIGEPFRERSE